MGNPKLCECRHFQCNAALHTETALRIKLLKVCAAVIVEVTSLTHAGEVGATTVVCMPEMRNLQQCENDGGVKPLFASCSETEARPLLFIYLSDNC